MRTKALVAMLAIVLLARTDFAATIAYWRFEEGAVGSPAAGAGSVVDASGNGLNGTPINGPIYSSSVAANPIPRTNAPNGSSLNFNGTNQRIFIPDNSLFQLTQSLTLEAYVFIRSAPAGDARYILFRGDDRANFDPYWLGVGTGQIAFAVDTASGVRTMLSTTIPAFNQWLHIAGTLDNTTGQMDLYVNNILDASTTTTNRSFGALDPTQNPGLGIGNVPSANYNDYFDGLIDEVRISDQALAPSQFLDSVPEPSAALVAGLGLILRPFFRRRRVCDARHCTAHTPSPH